MSYAPNSGLLICGAILVALGVGSFAYPIFVTQQTRDVAKIGDVAIQTTEGTAHSIPPLASGGALALGVILIGAGLFQRR